jgi:hypothetical protein
MLQEILLYLCIGQADAELICHSLFTLIGDLVAAGTFFGESAYLSLATEPGRKCPDRLPTVLSHSAQGHSGHLWILLSDG